MENFINFEPILSSESEDVKKYFLDRQKTFSRDLITNEQE